MVNCITLTHLTDPGDELDRSNHYDDNQYKHHETKQIIVTWYREMKKLHRKTTSEKKPMTHRFPINSETFA